MQETRTAPRESWDSPDLADPRQLPDDGLGQSPELETIWLEGSPHGNAPLPSGGAPAPHPLTGIPD